MRTKTKASPPATGAPSGFDTWQQRSKLNATPSEKQVHAELIGAEQRPARCPSCGHIGAVPRDVPLRLAAEIAVTP